MDSRRDAGRPRRFSMHTARPSSPPDNVRRKGAGDGLAARWLGRHSTVNIACPSAATCKRLSARASTLASGQASRPAKPPLFNNCSIHHAACFPGRTTSKRSGAIPAAAQAGACGIQGGATRASQPPAADSLDKAGRNRLISPMPLRSTRISLRQACGQPPPGNSSSSTG